MDYDNLLPNNYKTRGIEGLFYTTNRAEDLLEAAKEVLQEKLNATTKQQ
jgi:hypothetical protein